MQFRLLKKTFIKPNGIYLMQIRDLAIFKTADIFYLCVHFKK